MLQLVVFNILLIIVYHTRRRLFCKPHVVLIVYWNWYWTVDALLRSDRYKSKLCSAICRKGLEFPLLIVQKKGNKLLFSILEPFLVWVVVDSVLYFIILTFNTFPGITRTILSWTYLDMLLRRINLRFSCMLTLFFQDLKISSIIVTLIRQCF
jgi:hypothetical protein